jgi:hypothetical protein
VIAFTDALPGLPADLVATVLQDMITKVGPSLSVCVSCADAAQVPVLADILPAVPGEFWRLWSCIGAILVSPVAPAAMLAAGACPALTPAAAANS